MLYRKVENTDLALSVITLGIWDATGWYWNTNERFEAVDAIKAAVDSGITSIDTAPSYGQGASEEIVGEAIKNIPRDKIQILTKCGLRWDIKKGLYFFTSTDNHGNPIDVYRYSGKESIIEECENSLRRLGTDYIDLYQVHWPDPTTPLQETMEALNLLVEQGKIRHAGVCNFSAAQMKEAEKYINLVSDQVPYSMIKRNIEDELVPYLIKNNKALIAHSLLQLGLLTGKIKHGYKYDNGDYINGLNLFKDENVNTINKFLDKIKPFAAERKATLTQYVIGWALSQPGITVALVRARSPQQVIENAKAAEIKLEPAEINFISGELSKLQFS